jgi:hypothetical protein
MYHYNGQGWGPVSLSTIPGAFDLHAIHGSGPNDIWVAGEEIYYDPITMQFSDSSLIIHFDGTRWGKVAIPKSTALYCISVVSSTQVLAGSTRGDILQFDGTEWTISEIGQDQFSVSIAGLSPAEAYTVVNREDRTAPLDSAAFFLFRFDGSVWSAIDTIMRTPGSPPAHFGVVLSVWDDQLFSLGPNIYRFMDPEWEVILLAGVGRMWQSSPYNIFAVGQSVYHFNGIDWKDFPEFYTNPALWRDCYTDGNEVFVIGNDNSKTVVLHGQ